MDTTEKRFESDIEAFFLSRAGGYTKNPDSYDPKWGVWPDTLIRFVRETQPKAWKRFTALNADNPESKFIQAFNTACSGPGGVLEVLRNGFKSRGVPIKVCYFKPESELNETDMELYRKNILCCHRQWYYSASNKNSVDMVLTVNGIPVFAFELKNQFTGQTVENAKRQWQTDRSPKEVPFRFNQRVLAFFCVDLSEAWMATKLDGDKTYFLPFNQGSAGPGNDGGKGNPANPGGYPTDYLWKEVFQADSMLDLIRKFISLQEGKLIFPRYHQMDVVRKLVAHVRENGAGHNYLIQHSAGSGKSNSIAWTAYRMASLHDAESRPIFHSVVVVTDRRVLDQQLQNTISQFDHTPGMLETIGEGKSSQDLKEALNNGIRIIVTTLQKFPVIFDQVRVASGNNFAVIVDEAHSSQTGDSAKKLKMALADTREALAEYEEFEEEGSVDPQDELVKELLTQGKHHNLSFFAFTATPKGTTLEMFGEKHADGSFHPFHIYSMKQAIEEGFIMDVLQNYMTYRTCFRIAKTADENPEVPPSPARKVIRQYEELHPENIRQKSEIIAETFRETTLPKIGGKAKMMVVTASRAAAVLYFQAIKQYAEEKHYDDILPMVAFSGDVERNGEVFTESGLNVRPDGSHIAENQTKQEFHDHFNILIVAEKYQTGFDEPLLHTMIVDKKLRGVKTVQTLSRLNRTCPGKTDTFILDFANEAADIQQDFQLFYRETSLSDDINIDLIYHVQQQLRDYQIYDEQDIEEFCKVYFIGGRQNTEMQGLLVSKLLPTVKRYEAKDQEDRYQIRRTVRNLCKWYRYISQILRMFDKELHQEYVFCTYLSGLLPSETVPMEDIEGLLSLEFYKLEKTYEGDISLSPDQKGVYDPSSGGKGGMLIEEKDPLDEIIEGINELYKGDFTDADRVMINALLDKLLKDPSLAGLALSSDQKIFLESIFPQIFGKTAENSYMETQETYQTLFEDKAKYDAIMKVLASYLYSTLRGQEKSRDRSRMAY